MVNEINVLERRSVVKRIILLELVKFKNGKN